MADRARITDLELERALRAFAPRYPYPPTPNLAVRVRTRIVASPVRRRPGRAPWGDPRRLALVAALLLVLLGTAALVIPGSRDAIAHFFHVQGVIVNRVPSPAPSLTPPTSLNLGRLTTITDAQAAVRFTIAVPARLGPPDAVYVASGPPGGEVALAYTPRPGIPLVRQTGLGVLITEFRGDLIPGYITKEVGPGGTVEEVSVNGDPGWWIAGEPHTILVRVGPDSSQLETLRLAANTLVWAHGGVTYRIESDLSKGDAIRIAGSLP
jgi:hypothetical protein